MSLWNLLFRQSRTELSHTSLQIKQGQDQPQCCTCLCSTSTCHCTHAGKQIVPVGGNSCFKRLVMVRINSQTALIHCILSTVATGPNRHHYPGPKLISGKSRKMFLSDSYLSTVALPLSPWSYQNSSPNTWI